MTQEQQVSYFQLLAQCAREYLDKKRKIKHGVKESVLLNLEHKRKRGYV